MGLSLLTGGIRNCIGDTGGERVRRLPVDDLRAVRGGRASVHHAVLPRDVRGEERDE